MKLYKEMLDAEIAKRVCSFCASFDNSTRIYMTGSVRSWIHYIDCVLQMELRRSTWILHLVQKNFHRTIPCRCRSNGMDLINSYTDR